MALPYRQPRSCVTSAAIVIDGQQATRRSCVKIGAGCGRGHHGPDCGDQGMRRPAIVEHVGKERSNRRRINVGAHLFQYIPGERRSLTVGAHRCRVARAVLRPVHRSGSRSSGAAGRLPSTRAHCRDVERAAPWPGRDHARAVVSPNQPIGPWLRPVRSWTIWAMPCACSSPRLEDA